MHYDKDGKAYFKLGIEPLQTYGSGFEGFERIVEILLDNGIQPNVSLEELHKLLYDGHYIYFVSSDELPILELPDDVFLEVLLELGINRFIVSQYENAKNWVLYFNVVFNCYGEKGYLTYFSDAESIDCAVLCDSNPDALFKAGEFQWKFNKNEPLTTKYTKKDKQSSILQSLLKQNADSFIIQENSISYAPLESRYNDDDTIKNNIASLRAVNDLLEYPFFEIRNLSAEEVLNLNKLLAESP